MRYRVQLQGSPLPAFMVTANGVVIYVTHKLHWALGHDFEQIHRILTTIHATWTVLSCRTDKPNHSHWLDYDGHPSGAVLEH